MKQNNLLPRVMTRPGLFILAIAALISFASSANEPEQDSYSMSVFIEDPYGEELLEGNFEQVIADLRHESGKRTSDFSASNYLCVAYAIAKDIDNAKTLCEKAVISSRRALRRNKGGNTPMYETQLAMALSNRGVLSALAGNAFDAKQDFEAAIRLRTRVEDPVHNLQRLEGKIQAGLASL